MQINTKEVREGKHDGRVVWICHYNSRDIYKKPLRKVPPTKTLVVSNDGLWRDSYGFTRHDNLCRYNKSHFIPFNKNGKLSTRVVSPIDTTVAGYGEDGNELYVFDNEEECVKEWNNQLDHCISIVDGLIAVGFLHQKKNELLEMKK